MGFNSGFKGLIGKYKLYFLISGPKRSLVIWGCRKLHSEELNEVYFSQNNIRGYKLRKVT